MHTIEMKNGMKCNALVRNQYLEKSTVNIMALATD